MMHLNFQRSKRPENHAVEDVCEAHLNGDRTECPELGEGTHLWARPRVSRGGSSASLSTVIRGEGRDTRLHPHRVQRASGFVHTAPSRHGRLALAVSFNPVRVFRFPACR